MTIRNYRVFCFAVLALMLALNVPAQADTPPTEEPPALLKFNIDELSAQNATTDLPYLEFMRVESMSACIYELPAGTVDEQSPHDQDDIRAWVSLLFLYFFAEYLL